MTNVLEQYEPSRVWFYFEEICSIPHGSGNTTAISNYLKQFGIDHHLETYQDALGNIILIKDATPGYESEPPIMLQGHMDMVAVHRPELDIDMSREGLKLAVDGDNIYAKDTSLGGDDGIAVAISLALLEDTTLKHPRLEVLITIDEETGMDGARAVNLSMCRANRLLNLDSEDEGIFLAGCAGGARVLHRIPLDTIVLSDAQLSAYQTRSITISGLKGGHSGCEIHQERGNACKLMGRLLYDLQQARSTFLLKDINGGVADNAIPAQCTAIIAYPGAEDALIQKAIHIFQQEVSTELATRDPGFCVSISDQIAESSAPSQTDDDSISDPSADTSALAQETAYYSASTALSYLIAAPNGVQAFSPDVEGLVETSLNLGILKLLQEESRAYLIAEYSVRSSIESAKKELIHRLKALGSLSGSETIVSGSYPGWAYRKDSPLRDKMIKLFHAMYGYEPTVEAIHAGLECGLLAEKIKDLDCVSIGPDMKNIHSFHETLSISSTKRVYDFVRALLEQRD